MGVSPWEKRGVGLCFGVRNPIHRSSESSFTGMEAKRAYREKWGKLEFHPECGHHCTYLGGILWGLTWFGGSVIVYVVKCTVSVRV